MGANTMGQPLLEAGRRFQARAQFGLQLPAEAGGETRRFYIERRPRHERVPVRLCRTCRQCAPGNFTLAPHCSWYTRPRARAMNVATAPPSNIRKATNP